MIVYICVQPHGAHINVLTRYDDNSASPRLLENMRLETAAPVVALAFHQRFAKPDYNVLLQHQLRGEQTNIPNASRMLEQNKSKTLLTTPN